MKCLDCNQEMKKANKFCPNCGQKNLEFKENIIDKNIDGTIDAIQKVNTKIAQEFSESEHITIIVEKSKSGFKELNDNLSIVFLVGGVLTIIYSFIYEPNLYTNVFEYTKPDEYYGAAFGHFGYLFLYVSTLLLIPIVFIYINLSNNDKIKRWLIPLIIIFVIFMIIYVQEFTQDDRWKNGLLD